MRDSASLFSAFLCTVPQSYRKLLRFFPATSSARIRDNSCLFRIRVYPRSSVVEFLLVAAPPYALCGGIRQ